MARGPDDNGRQPVSGREQANARDNLEVVLAAALVVWRKLRADTRDVTVR